MNRADDITVVSNSARPSHVIIDTLHPINALELICRFQEIISNEIPIAIITDDVYGEITT